MNTNAESIRACVLRSRVRAEAHLAPTGSLNTEEILQELRAAVAECMEGGDTKIVIDLAAASVVNSEAIEALLDFSDELLKAGGRLQLAKANVILRDIFRVTGLDQQISVLVDDSDPHAQTSATTGKPTLGKLLAAHGLVTEAQVDQALQLQEKSGKRLGEIIVEQGWVPEQELLSALGTHLSVPFVRLRAGLYDPVVAQLMDKDLAVRLRVLPMFRVRGAVYLATTQPQDIPLLTEVGERLGVIVKPVLRSKLARPKSVIQTCALASSIKFAGLMSRWTTPL